MSAVQEIKARIDILEVIGSRVALKKSGRTLKGLCPFHPEKTPSFVVYPEEQRWYCFGACGEGGDVFSFLMKAESLSFPEALRQLAGKAGVELEAPSAQAQEAARRRRKLEELNRAAAEAFHRLLLESPAAGQARRYLDQRGISQEMVSAFELGFALDSWEGLQRSLGPRGYRPEELLEAGLLIQGRHGPYDRFRGRLMFPIRDAGGAVLGFGARALRPEQQPKYLNSPQTPLFDKSSVLYGLDRAQQAIREAGLAVVAEGYTDVIAAHQHGFGNVVASLGTSLTEGQVRALKRLAPELVLALDADAAGQEATLRGLEVAQEVAGETVPVVHGPGLVRHERRLAATIRILPLPAGLDPDEAIRQDPQGWPQRVAAALPVADFYFQALTRDLELERPKDKIRAAERLLPLIREMGTESERAHYLGRLARLTGLPEQALLRDMHLLARRSTDPQRQRRQVRQVLEALTGPGSSMDAYVLALLLRQPEEAPDLPLDEEDLDPPEYRAVLAQLKAGRDPEALGEEEAPVLAEAVEALRARAAALPELEEEELNHELREKVWLLKERRCRRELRQVESLLSHAEGSEERTLLLQRAVRLQSDLKAYQDAREGHSLMGRVRNERWQARQLRRAQ